jgi:dihydrofolate reductase
VVCEEFTEAVSIGKEQAEEDGRDEVCVIGGVSLFELALPRARRIYLTEVHADVEGDITLKGFDERQWKEVRSQDYPAGEDDEYPFTIRVLERR